MRNERSLLDRLDHRTGPASYTTRFDSNAMLDNVIANVQNMLNVRLGSVTALDNYGMPDFNDVVNQFPDAVSHIRQAIREFLQTYEPRLENIHVHYLPDPEQPLLLRFAIEATLRHQDLASRDQKTRVAFDTVLTGAGQATVRV